MEDRNVSPKSSKSNVLTWVILAILVLATCVGAYFILRLVFGTEQNTDNGTEVTEEGSETGEEENTEEPGTEEEAGTGEEVSEDCTQNPAPSGWTAVESTYLAYVAYRPGWYFRIFGGGTTLGLDPNPIPVDSEYAGMLTVNKLSGTVDSQVSSFTSQLEDGYTQTAVTAGCREWTVVEGTIPANEIFDAKQAKAGFTSAAGVTYQVLYQTGSSAFATHESKFDTLIDIMVFNE